MIKMLVNRHCALVVALCLWVAAGSLRAESAPFVAAVSPSVRVSSCSGADYVDIVFEEPLAPLSCTDRGLYGEGTERRESCGVKFHIEGNRHHLLQTTWADQDVLRIRFPEGCSSRTEYVLMFDEGTRYLGGREMPQRRISFSCPPCELVGEPMGDAEGSVVLVSAGAALTSEACSLSPASDVRYVFREVRQAEPGKQEYWGDEVGAVVCSAPLKYGLGRASQEILAKRFGEEGAEVGGDASVDGQVLVRPSRPLPGGRVWCLLAQGGEGSGFVEQETELCRVEPCGELRTEVAQSYLSEGKCRIELSFSHPVSLKEMPDIFRKIRFSSSEACAREEDGGESKVLIMGEETIKFRYVGATPPDKREWRMGDDTYRYAPEGVSSTMQMEAVGTFSRPVDVTIPAGVVSALGVAVRRDRTHRLLIGSAWPDVGDPEEGALQVPWHGSHKVRIPVSGVDSVAISLWYIPKDKVLAKLEKWNAREMGRVLRERPAEVFLQRLMQARVRGGLEVEDCLEMYDDRVKRGEPLWKKALSARQRLCEGVVSFPERKLTPLAGGNFSEGASCLEVDLDDLTRGKTLPGVYLLSLRGTPNSAVKKLMEQSRLDADLLSSERAMLVEVSDMNVFSSGGTVVVTNLSDGKCVRNAEIRTLSGRTWPVVDGGAVGVDDGGARKPAAVVAGDDYKVYWGRTSSEIDLEGEDGEAFQVAMISDRPLYRPGETVRLKLIARRCLPDGSMRKTRCRRVKIDVLKPNSREVLFQEEKLLNEYGCAEVELALPDGEDDVTGDYTVRVKGGSRLREWRLPCQVFRRNAFKVKWGMEAAAVAPESALLSVQAVDYNGMPVSGGRVKLLLQWDPASFGETPQAHRVEARLDGRGMWKEEVSLPRLPEASSCLRVSGEVANDREETVALEEVCHAFSSSDLMLRVSEGLVRVVSVSTGAAVVAPVTMAVKKVAESEQKIIGGLVRVKREKQENCLPERTLTVGKEGLPLSAWFDEKEVESLEDASYILSVKDGEGRETRCAGRWMRFFPRRSAESREDMDLRCVEGRLEGKAFFPAEGEVHAFVDDGRNTRHVLLAVKKGENPVSVPLLEGENGFVRLSLMQALPDERGFFCRSAMRSGYAIVPCADSALDVTLEIPPLACRPGETVSLGGKVAVDGEPVEAEVLLYAVDEGMISKGDYAVPDPATCFNNKVGKEYRFISGKERWNMWEKTLAPMYWEGDLLGAAPGERGGGYRMIPFWGAPQDGSFGAFPLMRRGKGLRDNGVLSACMGGRDADGDLAAGAEEAAPDGVGKARLRVDFSPLAFWKADVRTDADGRFREVLQLPDTLTSYRVYAVAVDKSGKRGGVAQGTFLVNQPVMLTPDVPFFMSLGDCLTLPVSVANNTEEKASWVVSMGGREGMRVELSARGSETLFFDYEACAEGEQTLRWEVAGATGSDAVQEKMIVRFPAPLLKEVHHLRVLPQEASLRAADLLAPELAASRRGQMHLSASANPLIFAEDALEFLVSHSYECTEQTASAMIPWLLYEHVAPFSPEMREVSLEGARENVAQAIEKIFSRQREDGGLGYWGRETESDPWVSAYAAMVLSMARDRGFHLPEDQMKLLLRYVSTIDRQGVSGCTLYAIGRAVNSPALMREAVEGKEEGGEWRVPEVGTSDWAFLSRLLRSPSKGTEAFVEWLRSRGGDSRYMSSLSVGWMLVAIDEYLKTVEGEESCVSLALEDGTTLPLGRGATDIDCPLEKSVPLGAVSRAFSARGGIAYVVVRAKAQPEKRYFPGVVEKGLQVTRSYEVRDARGEWAPADLLRFKVGDIVRVTLTVAKVPDEVNYLVLEDYLPSCMEAVNPHVPDQSLPEALLPWSAAFDHREYLRDRVRGFCSKWRGRNLLNMCYYARVKRAGSCVAPPAQAQLMYEPQIYGLSPNEEVKSER